jgi:hypothetical protein
MNISLPQWCERVALQAYREKADRNGMLVTFSMIAALVGDDAAMGIMESAASVHQRFEEAEQRGAEVFQRKGVRFT